MYIFVRLNLIFIIIITIFALLISFLSYYSLRSHYLNTITSHLENSAILTRNLLETLMKNPDIVEIDSMVDNLAKGLNVRITVVDISGTVLGDSQRNPMEMENHKERIEIKDALSKGFGKSMRYSTTLNESMLYVAIPIKEGEKTLGVVRNSISLKKVKTLLEEMRNKLLLSFIITVFIAFLTSILLTKIFTKPIIELKKTSMEIAKGNFHFKMPESNVPEFRELAKNFQSMTLNIKELIGKIEREGNELRAIIENIKEALVVTDKKGIITIANSAFKNLSRTENSIGRFFWEVLRNIDLKDMFEKAMKSQHSEIKEISIGNNFYLASCAILPEELIFVFTDITPLKQIEKTKRELISNISHELKTPLTAIKGFVETLEERVQDPESISFVKIIKRQTERMINILKDILTLSRLEDRAFQLRIETVNLNELIENTMKLFEKRAKDKGLEMEFSCEKKIVINADPELLEQLLINLIENAINYTERGKIGISLNSSSSTVKIEVFDTGIGIPEEHIPRIFERFHVVDKSRSKETGGTGLGLSIVKHIVLLHNGDIKVESKIGEGSKFTVTLPL